MIPLAIAFAVGVTIGCGLGIAMLSMLVVASNADRAEERHRSAYAIRRQQRRDLQMRNLARILPMYKPGEKQ